MGIKVRDVAFVRFQAPDLEKMEEFLVSFGMVRSDRTDDTLYMRGTNDEGFVHVTHRADEAGVLGWAFEANEVSDLEHLALLEGFSGIQELDGPGGGRVVRTTAPDGFQVEVVAGRGSIGALPEPNFPERNEARAYQRKGSPVRLASPSASHVKRLGHLVITVADFATSAAWYKEHFGLVVSDEIHTDEGEPFGAFFRCDQGKMFVDHHTIGIMGSGKSGFSHCAFEVENFDDLMLGNARLAEGGYQHDHGIGRHILGSQIYDYWRDPWGNVVEHWTDGDLFNDETPPNITDFAALRGDQWGPTTARDIAGARL